jgi:LPS-assembly lipoprotein
MTKLGISAATPGSAHGPMGADLLCPWPMAQARLRPFLAVLVLALACPLAACGFEPLYARNDRGVSPVEDLAAVQVELIPNRSGQILRTYLRDGLNPNNVEVPRRYTLRVTLVEPRQELALQRNDTVARYGYGVAAGFVLIDAAGRGLFQGAASLSTNYEVSDSQFATLSSLYDARDRAMQVISDDIRNQLAVYFRGRPTTGNQS